MDETDTATGCQGIYNPGQILEYRITLAEADWARLKADTTNATFFCAELQCGSEPPITVGVRRKRSGGIDKPGIKIDVNLVVDQAFYGLKKLSLENGTGSGSDAEPERAELLHEYFAWRIMQRTGAIGSRAVFAHVFVNDTSLGLYVNVEQPDKRFLAVNIGDDNGWLYKKSGFDDGYKTNETVANPYEDRLCFFASNPCPMPSAAELETLLPNVLDIEQVLRFGAGNALMANSDGPLGKDNNYYFYDWPNPRLYLAWDLDTTQRQTSSVFPAASDTAFTSVLFTHWEDDYDRILTDLLNTTLTLDEILGELDRALALAAGLLDADPFAEDGSAADAGSVMRSWWTTRHAQALAEVQGH
jgi:spore coat protein CotH